nr:hypothetical protein [Tanacetum cinerariifolium]
EAHVSIKVVRSGIVESWGEVGCTCGGEAGGVVWEDLMEVVKEHW